MFSKILSTAVLAAILVRADVEPTTPSGSDVFREGETCLVEWAGDSSGEWAGMAIQLMSGDNFNMVHVTTIATDQDGNANGKFEYKCPEVTPNSAIYFYQFSAPGTDTLTWTTRWTLAAADGSTTPPSESTQPGGDAIPWGAGSLDDASAVVPPPTFDDNASSAAPEESGSSSSHSATGTRSLPGAATSEAGTTSDTATSSDASEPTSSRLVTRSTPPAEQSGRPSSGSASAEAASSTVDPNGAMAIMGSRALQVLLASSLVFALLF